jgi:hypothetical protein
MAHPSGAAVSQVLEEVDSRRSSIGEDLNTTVQLTDTMIHACQALGIMKDEPRAPKERKELHAANITYLDAQRKFMELSKKRAVSQEKFLKEAEDLKNQDSGDLVGTLRKFIHNSPLLVKRTENLMGRNRPQTVTGFTNDSLLIVGTNEDQLGSSLSLSRGALSPPSMPGRCQSTPPVLRHSLDLDLSVSRGGFSPIRPPLTKSRPDYKMLLAEQDKMHTSVNSYDEKYKAVFSHFVESERSAFDRLGIDVAEHMGSMYLGSSGSPTMPVAAR